MARKKRKKRTEKDKLITEAKKLWKQKCLQTSNKCENCGSKFILQGHHFYKSRSFPTTRYSMDNCVVLCRACHSKHHLRGDNSVHGKIVKARGWEWHDRLTKEAHKIEYSFQTKEYYEETVKRLSKLCKHSTVQSNETHLQ